MKKQPIVVISVALVLGIGAYFLWLKPRTAPTNPAPGAHEEHKSEAAGDGHIYGRFRGTVEVHQFHLG